MDRSVFYTTPSGTAGNAATLTAQMSILNNGNISIGTSTPNQKLVIQGTAGANDVLSVTSSTGASLLYVAGNGFVGIGTSTPNQPFVEQTNGSYSSVASWYSGNTALMSLNWNGNLYLSGVASLAGGKF